MSTSPAKTGAAARPAEPSPDPRQRGLLDAAVAVFTRYGYRKTSMEEVARAAQISRQGLYLYFSTKEDLFRAAVKHALDGSLQAVTAVLREGSLALEPKLVRAFDEWVGKYVGMAGTGAADLAEATHTLVGPMVAEHEARFAEALARSISASGLVAAYRPAGLTARQLADTLIATARGFKYGAGSRDAFVRGMTVAVRALCAPLPEARR
jgi:AcrR family transcriptional regulator